MRGVSVPGAAATAGVSGSTTAGLDCAGAFLNSFASIAAKTPSVVGGRRNKRIKKRRTGGARPGLDYKRDVAVLRAQGASRPSVAGFLGVSTQTVKNVERRPEVQAYIQALREQWKQGAHEHIAGMTEKTWNLAEHSVDQKNTKDFDNMMRGIVALERVSASVAGETQRVEVSGQAPTAHIELKVLLHQLLGTPPPPH